MFYIEDVELWETHYSTIKESGSICVRVCVCVCVHACNIAVASDFFSHPVPLFYYKQ